MNNQQHEIPCTTNAYNPNIAVFKTNKKNGKKTQLFSQEEDVIV